MDKIQKGPGNNVLSNTSKIMNKFQMGGKEIRYEWREHLDCVFQI